MRYGDNVTRSCWSFRENLEILKIFLRCNGWNVSESLVINFNKINSFLRRGLRLKIDVKIECYSCFIPHSSSFVFKNSMNSSNPNSNTPNYTTPSHMLISTTNKSQITSQTILQAHQMTNSINLFQSIPKHIQQT